MRYSENFTKRLKKTELGKDQGVTFTSDLNWKNYIFEITVRANRILGSLKKSFVRGDPTLWKNLYISLVRPHLEYVAKVWSPTKETYIGSIEKVQARATKIPYSMRNLRFEARLTKWAIKMLEYRCVRDDLFEIYKYVNGSDEIN